MSSFVSLGLRLQRKAAQVATDQIHAEVSQPSDPQVRGIAAQECGGTSPVLTVSVLETGLGHQVMKAERVQELFDTDLWTNERAISQLNARVRQLRLLMQARRMAARPDSRLTVALDDLERALNDLVDSQAVAATHRQPNPGILSERRRRSLRRQAHQAQGQVFEALDAVKRAGRALSALQRRLPDMTGENQTLLKQVLAQARQAEQDERNERNERYQQRRRAESARLQAVREAVRQESSSSSSSRKTKAKAPGLRHRPAMSQVRIDMVEQMTRNARGHFAGKVRSVRTTFVGKKAR